MSKRNIVLVLSLLLYSCGDDLGWSNQPTDTTIDCDTTHEEDTDEDTLQGIDTGIDDINSADIWSSDNSDADDAEGTEILVSVDSADDVEAPTDATSIEDSTSEEDTVISDVGDIVSIPAECTVSSDCANDQPCAYAWCDDGKCKKDLTLLDSTPCQLDGSVCTIDKCLDGKCLSAGSLFCEDNNPCTDNLCDAEKGCEAWANIGACDDGSTCTGLDVCSGGSCQPGPTIDCDDANPCTSDSCSEDFGCIHDNNSAPCNDGVECTLDDACSNGMCLPGDPTSCEDQNPCTDDTCDILSGCVNEPNDVTCTDQNACTEQDKCELAMCLGVSVVCEDGNACTSDLCDTVVGCVSLPIAATCTDNSSCTEGDNCEQGICTSIPIICNDQNECTADTCDISAGCTYNAQPNGTKCGGGTCANGVCTCLTGFGCAAPKFIYNGDVTAGMLGGMGGVVGPKMGCATTDVLIGIGFDFSNNTKTATRTTVVCGTVTADQTGNVTTTQTTTQKNGGSGCSGWEPTAPTPITKCPNGWVIVGITGNKPGSTLFNSVSIVCSQLSVGGVPVGTEQTIAVPGMPGTGTPQSVKCPVGTIARYFETRAGCGQDALTLYCAKANPDCTGQPLICKD